MASALTDCSWGLTPFETPGVPAGRAAAVRTMTATTAAAATARGNLERIESSLVFVDGRPTARRYVTKLFRSGQVDNRASTFRLLPIQTPMLTLTLQDFDTVRARIAPHIKHTPLLTSRQLS